MHGFEDLCSKVNFSTKKFSWVHTSLEGANDFFQNERTSINPWGNKQVRLNCRLLPESKDYWGIKIWVDKKINSPQPPLCSFSLIDSTHSMSSFLHQEMPETVFSICAESMFCAENSSGASFTLLSSIHYLIQTIPERRICFLTSAWKFFQ